MTSKPGNSTRIKSLKESEKDHLTAVLTQTHWDIPKTARLLKISITALKSKMSFHGLAKACHTKGDPGDPPANHGRGKA